MLRVNSVIMDENVLRAHLGITKWTIRHKQTVQSALGGGTSLVKVNSRVLGALRGSIKIKKAGSTVCRKCFCCCSL